jgi:hypothetical protein
MHALPRAQIDVITPRAPQEEVPLTHGGADGTAFKQVSNYMARDFAPGFHHFLFFLQFVKFFLIHHGQPPFLHTIFQCNQRANLY